ncbi:MAG: hypothetical protein GVY13_13410 [Alphaproteobacteria bacterium]|jgi:hypothetical protein|nr:hypothetical protein [Alphaproteobacteria bacterium]
MILRLRSPARAAGRLAPALLLAAGAALAACTGPVSEPFSEPEVRVEPPPSVPQPLGVSGPSATRF